MKARMIFCIILFLLFSLAASAQEKDQGLRGRIPGLALKITPQEIKEYDLLPYGYAQLSNSYDTRQLFGDNEVLGTFFPKPIVLDPRGHDINDHPEFRMVVTQSTIGLLARGPNWDSVKTFATLETDFLGESISSIGCMHVRHLFSFLDWQKGSLLMGQYWHPLALPQCWPGVVNFNGGAPFEIFSRDPQIRLTQRFDGIEIMASVASQFDFTSNGPFGPTRLYIERAVIPNIDAQIHLIGDSYFGGVAFDYKRLKPRLVSNKHYNVHEHIDSFLAQAFLKLNVTESLSLRMKGIWGQNANDLGLISGFGVKTVNPITDARTYANTAAASGWFDVTYFFDKEQKYQLGLFVAYAKNLGSQQKLFIDPKTKLPIIYALSGVSQNIDDLFRISPRYIIQHNPFLISFELEFTQTAWGHPNERGKVIHAKNANNVRLLAQINYVF